MGFKKEYKKRQKIKIESLKQPRTIILIIIGIIFGTIFGSLLGALIGAGIGLLIGRILFIIDKKS